MNKPGNQPNTIAAKLRKFRLSAGYSQQNVADVLKMNRSTYSYYETGKTMPDVRTLAKIAEIFSIPIEEFFQPEVNETELADQKKRRSSKRVAKEPVRIGELSSEEKFLIALLRSNALLSTADIAQAVQRKIEVLEKNSRP